MPGPTDDLSSYHVTPTTDLAFQMEAESSGLSGVLDRVSLALPTSGPFPILTNVYISTEADGLTVSATNLEMTAVARASHVKVAREGSGIFPGRRMLEVARAAGDDALTLDAKGGKATVSTARTTWEMPLAHAETYPQLPELNDGGTTIEPAPFIDALQTVRLAAARETTRPSLRMVDVTSGFMRASDGVRYVEAQVSGVPDLHIPYTAVGPLIAALRDERGSVRFIELEEHYAYLFGSSALLTRKLVEHFPKVDEAMLVPALKNNDQHLKVQRVALLDAVRRVRVAADEDSSAVTLKLESSRIEVRARDRAGNTAREGLRASWRGDGGRTVAFHHQMLTDALRSGDSEEVEMLFAPDSRTRRSPLLITGDVTSVVSQVRVD